MDTNNARSVIRKTEHPLERSLVLVKPDGVQRGLVGEVIKRYERAGLKIVGLKFLVPTREMVEKHYTLGEEWLNKVGERAIKSFADKGETAPASQPLEMGKIIWGYLSDYLTTGPVVAMVLQGANVVKIVRKITGGTEPLTSDVGTIRGDFVIDSYEMAESQFRSVRNVIHASGTVEEAEKEIAQWFSPEELIEYRTTQEMIMYEDFTHLLGK